MTDAPRRRRQSPAVYRRRRLAAGLLALVVIGLVVWLVAAPPWRVSPTAAPTSASSSSEPSASASASAAPTTSAAPTATPTPHAPAGPVECTAGSITVEALSSKAEYAPGENPQLSIRLTNTSATPCEMNVGTSAQSFTVTSGSDVWWRSTDCQSAPSDMEVTLSAGQVVTSSAPLEWDRTRSSVSTCEEERPYAPGGGATYHLSVSIGGIPSAGTASFVLQ